MDELAGCRKSEWEFLVRSSHDRMRAVGVYDRYGGGYGAGVAALAGGGCDGEQTAENALNLKGMTNE